MEHICAIRLLAVGVFLLTEGIKDWRKKEIDLIFPALISVLAILFVFVFKDIGWIEILLGFVQGLVLIGVSFLTDGGIGEGDGIVFCVTGVMLGWKMNLMIIFISSFICALTSIILMILKKADKKTKIPFIPFTVPAYLVTVLINYQ